MDDRGPGRDRGGFVNGIPGLPNFILFERQGYDYTVAAECS
jgi:hypothetical protein